MSRPVSAETRRLAAAGAVAAGLALVVAVGCARPEAPADVPDERGTAGRVGVLARPLSQLRRETFRVEDGLGLPQNSVFALAQSADGYLWLGTQEGVARYNGVAFRTFDRNTTEALEPSEVVEWLVPAPGGGVVAATNRGVASLDGERQRRLFPAALDSASVQSVAFTPDGALWAGTTEGLLRCADAACASVLVGGQTAGRVQALVADGPVVWAGTSTGVVRVEGARVQRVRDGLPSPSVLALGVAAGGGVWAGTEAGAARVGAGGVEPVPAGAGWPAGAVYAVAEDAAGAVWLGTDGALVRVAGGVAETLTDGFAGHRVVALAFDRDGSLWAGTTGGGLVHLHEGAFATLTPETSGLASADVLSVAEDARGRLWATTADGTLNRVRQRGTQLDVEPERRFGRPASSVIGAGDVVWVGTLGEGLWARLGSDEWRQVTEADGLPSGVVTALHVGPSGGLWAGTNAGVARLDGDPRAPRVETLGRADGLPSDVVTAVLETAAGALWVGTYDGGLAVRERGRWQTVGADVLGTPVVSALYEDAEGTVWVGTYGGGLLRIPDGDLGRAFRVTPRHGLFDDKVYQILEDGGGMLWMGCNAGVFRVAKADVAAVAEGRAARLVSVAYDEDDGLATREANGGTQPAGWVARDGRVWLPTTGGLAVVDPAALRSARAAPPVVVEAARVDGVLADLGAPVQMRPGARRVEFDFVALALTDPTAVRYRYRLEGYDADWSEPTTLRAATYTHLDPGRYRFRVIARNEDGVWNDVGAAVGVRMLPHPWQTGWFWGLVALAVAAAGTAAYRWRIRELTVQQRHLEREVVHRTRDLSGALAEKEVLLREVHHRVKNNLQIIASLLSLQSAKTADPGSKALLRDARSRVVSMAAVHERIYQADSLSQIDGGPYVRSVAEGQFRSFNVAEGVRLDVETASALLTPDAAIPLGLIVNELVSNALKHGFPEGVGRLRVLFGPDGSGPDGEGLRLSVEDDGPGLPAAFSIGSGTSLGLVLVRSLAQKLGGTVAAGPAHGSPSGSRFDIAFPAQCPPTLPFGDGQAAAALPTL